MRKNLFERNHNDLLHKVLGDNLAVNRKKRKINASRSSARCDSFCSGFDNSCNREPEHRDNVVERAHKRRGFVRRCSDFSARGDGEDGMKFVMRNFD